MEVAKKKKKKKQQQLNVERNFAQIVFSLLPAALGSGRPEYIWQRMRHEALYHC
jgi:hypothetical protein